MCGCCGGCWFRWVEGWWGQGQGTLEASISSRKGRRAGIQKAGRGKRSGKIIFVFEQEEEGETPHLFILIETEL